MGMPPPNCFPLHSAAMSTFFSMTSSPERTVSCMPSYFMREASRLKKYLLLSWKPFIRSQRRRISTSMPMPAMLRLRRPSEKSM